MEREVNMDHSKKYELILEILNRIYSTLTHLLENNDLDNNDVINIVCSVVAMMGMSACESEIESSEDMEKARSDENVKLFIEEIVKRLKGFISGEEDWGFVPPKYRR